MTALPPLDPDPLDVTPPEPPPEDRSGMVLVYVVGALGFLAILVGAAWLIAQRTPGG